MTLHRTDLALFDLDLATRTVSCNLVEVKCCAQRLGLSGYGQLKERITQQINQSERILQRHFDPHRTAPDRPDRLLKSRELATLLDFYLERGLRYRLMECEAGEEARAFLDRLEDGYRLQFSRSGLVFDFDKPGTEPPEHEVDIEFHRVGVDLIHELVKQVAAEVPERSPTDGGGDSGEGGSAGDSAQEAAAEMRPVASIPRLDAAAFLVAERPRSTSDLDDWPRTDEEADITQVVDAQQSEADLSDGSSRAVRGEPTTTAVTEPADSVGSPLSEDGPGSADNAVPSEPVSPPVDTRPQPLDEVDPPTPEALEPAAGDELGYDAILGVTGSSPQYGLLGETSGRKIALDLNQTHTISLFGVQGGGKSYTVGSVVEMACMPVDGVNVLPHPLASVVFHYSSTLDYRPEFTSMAAPNRSGAEVDPLRNRFGASPRGLSDLVILAPAVKVEERRAEYPGIEVMPVAFTATELKASHWKFLMGAVGSQSMYIRQLTLIMKKLRGKLTLAALRQGVRDSGLSDYLKELALLRLQFAEDYIDDARRLTDILRPGRLVIVDLRDELIEKDEALGLFVVLLQMFAETTYQGRRFNKLVVFDETHKYIDSPDLVAGLVEVVREMRHKGTSIMVASQDPPPVPTSLIERGRCRRQRRTRCGHGASSWGCRPATSRRHPAGSRRSRPRRDDPGIASPVTPSRCPARRRWRCSRRLAPGCPVPQRHPPPGLRPAAALAVPARFGGAGSTSIVRLRTRVAPSRSGKRRSLSPRSPPPRPTAPLPRPEGNRGNPGFRRSPSAGPGP